MAQWRNGAMAQWRNGAMAQWRNGAMAQWLNSGSLGVYIFCLGVFLPAFTNIHAPFTFQPNDMIFNMTGEIVYTNTFCTKVEGAELISLPTLASGMYVVKLFRQNGELLGSEKLQIQQSK